MIINKEIENWINNSNKTSVSITKSLLSKNDFWFYDDKNGEILNQKRTFFSIIGVQYYLNSKFLLEQPIILQDEIGILGIIAKKFDNEYKYLMQSKIEPGNINFSQISPTIQATKSNFTRAHGGKYPNYFEFFDNVKNKIIYDQIQSEQGSRFLKKRNRNIIIEAEKDIELLPNYMWLTFDEINKCLKYNNLVNMDTRTVLSGLYNVNYNKQVQEEFQNAVKLINDFKLHNEVYVRKVPLYELRNWTISDDGITSNNINDFSVRYFDISINGREVKKWFQPLIVDNNKKIFALISSIINGERMYLLHLCPEVGNFDKVEYGPSIMSNYLFTDLDKQLFDLVYDNMKNKNGIIENVLLSEEGGRFYHEQNRNLIIDINYHKLPKMDNNYFWAHLDTVKMLIKAGNYMNIQLRNLVTLIDKQ